jgi:3-dehydroquinate synthase
MSESESANKSESESANKSGSGSTGKSVREFRIGSTTLRVTEDPATTSAFEVKSVPVPYLVRWDARPPAVVLMESLREGDLLLIDRNVRRLHFSQLQIAPERVFELEPTEAVKTLEGGVLPFVDFLAARNANRGSRVIVVGGGIVQDIGAFAAAAYKRGIPWVLYPTTLLSLADSCIGGKTGINHQGAKNQLALFSAPREVVLCPRFIDTLAPQERWSGLGEIFKLHLTGGPAFLDEYARGFPYASTQVAEETWRRLILASLLVKKAVVEADEFELDIRRAMNLGHTVGHVVESQSGYRLPHGLAVVVGMLVVNELARARGLLSAELCAAWRKLGLDLVAQGPLATLRGLDPAQLGQLLGKDKKAQGARIPFVIARAAGRLEFVPIENTPSLQTEIVGILESLAQDAGA